MVGIFWGLSSLPCVGTEQVFDAAVLEFFEREVRPLLAKRCYECHSRATAEPKGGLLLDSRDAALVGGDTGPAIVAGDPAASLLIDAVNYGDIYQMPPKTRLPANEVAVLTKWIDLGAPWPQETVDSTVRSSTFDLQSRRDQHWCWQPIVAPPIPEVQRINWPQQELDAFILSRLESSGLSPAPPADRGTLIRRLYFDLVGLPPSEDAVTAFVENTAPRAFESLVDELLDSPHFGERWARHWLDLVRYAETYGHEFDYPIAHAAKYRDYLIRAFNSDVPFDQFVKEHVAGDLLPEPRRHPSEDFNESIIGTGFWWLGEATHSPVDVRDDEARRIDNQIDVLTKTFLGLTVACARCHDHKFDAISTADYYAFAGFLQSSRKHQAPLDPGASNAQAAQRIADLRAVGGRTLATAVRDQGLTANQFATHLEAARALATGGSTTAEVPEASRWLTALQAEELKEVEHPLHLWHRLVEQKATEVGDLERLVAEFLDGAKLAESVNESRPLLADFEDGFQEWLPSGNAFGSSPAESSQLDWTQESDQFSPPGIASSRQLSPRFQGVLRSPTFTLRHPNIFYKISGDQAQVRLILDGYFMDVFNALLFNGFSIDVNTEGKTIWLRQAQDVGRYVGHRAYIEIIDHSDGYVAVDEIRFSDGPPPEAIPSTMARTILGDSAVNRDFAALAAGMGRCWAESIAAIENGSADAEQTELVNWVLCHHLLDASGPELSKIKQELTSLADGIRSPEYAVAMTEGSPENEHIFIRGNYRTLGEEVPRRFLTALGGPAEYQGSGRFELAQQIVDPSNPLTSRVIVNRLWQHLFGQGIVASVDNFGVLGRQPTHPELLDHLATQFVDGGWSIKRLLRSLLLSSTYQMDSSPRTSAEEIDPQNRLLHRMRIRRLEAEVIRDAILSVSGSLDATLFGPSIPTHVTEFMQGRGRPKESGPLDGRGRRSIYLQVRRNFLSPMMLAFDVPIPFNTVGRRNISNVPAQALILMNDPFVIAQAEKWAERVVGSRGSNERNIDRMYLAAFARHPSTEERNDCLQFLAEQANAHAEANAAQRDLQAWADLAHALFNVKEFIFLK